MLDSSKPVSLFTLCRIEPGNKSATATHIDREHIAAVQRFALHIYGAIVVELIANERRRMISRRQKMRAEPCVRPVTMVYGRGMPAARLILVTGAIGDRSR